MNEQQNDEEYNFQEIISRTSQKPKSGILSIDSTDTTFDWPINITRRNNGLTLREFIEAAPKSRFRIWNNNNTNTHYAAVIGRKTINTKGCIFRDSIVKTTSTYKRRIERILLPLDCIYDASLNMDLTIRFPPGSNIPVEKDIFSNQFDRVNQ